MGQDITIQTKDGNQMGGYLALPATGSGPAVVAIQEIFGVNKVMRDICDWLAGEGFVAISPDLFWRIEPGIQLTDQSEAEWARAFELFQAFDADKGVEDIQATIDHVRGLEACTGKVGATGYCLGGLLAYLTAARTDADCAVGYYGVGIEGKLAEKGDIKKPLILHIAKEDGFCNAEAQAAIHAGLDDHPHVTIHDYEGQDHAFARVGGEHYNAEAAAKANGRTLELFRSALK
ncbi:MAG: dienelactone hydrolase family protein [Minwuia sp.]|uniref:dienelactone hydrolase family protein n=1 Tax=Minwuia sp. TaxID=2493630 RepID=UPI003A8745FE